MPRGEGTQPLAEWSPGARTSYKQMMTFDDMDKLSLPSDGEKRVDYVLVWEVPEKEDEKSARAQSARENFEKNLVEEGLQLEYDNESEENVKFVKVHAPYEVLTRYAEILKIKMKMKKESVEMNPVKAVSTTLWNSVLKVKDVCLSPFKLDETLLPEITKEPSLVYSRDKEYLHQEDVIRRILHCCLPTTRGSLESWVSYEHPNYYGSQIAMYFAWLGFYTQFLIPPSILGLAIFLYGIIYMDDSYPSKEICDPSLNMTMCPLCDYKCGYWKLNASCGDSTYSRMFDNNATFWKRKQSVIQYNWDLVEFVKEEEPPRPEYLARLANYPRMKVNPITGMKEPHLPFFRRRLPIFMLSYGFMLFTMAIAIGGVVGVIAYRVSTLAALQLLESKEQTNGTLAETQHLITENASIITTITAACINLILIIILNMIYSRVAVWLTDFECLRTQSLYDNSINIKLFSLQFVNYYSSIIYIAFFKGRLVGRPGMYNMAFGARQEEAFIIALTSDFIPRLVYVYGYSEDKSMIGYTRWSLSQFNTSHFEPDKYVYKDFRYPPGHVDDAGQLNQYEYSDKHWHVLAARFAFNLVVVLTSLVAYAIPDVPAKVKKQIRREAYVSSEIVIKTELDKARGKSVDDIVLGSLAARFKKGLSSGNGSELRKRTNEKTGEVQTVDETGMLKGGGEYNADIVMFVCFLLCMTSLIK
ncbi:ANO1-like protein [Mya arenaria]|uniref:Anoctamin n=1 Tax=Mya arenaria TaxID=6604 RepID=A0ABY7EFX8_MYAAR|nr:ANO1-like protein [Mya arenaria]